jgi:hypothetical protein
MHRFVVSALFLVVVVSVLSGCQGEPEHDRIMKLVKETLKKQGIQTGVEPVVKLSQKGEEWVGTATYGEIVYDLRVFKKGNDLMLERQMRPPAK